MNRKNFPSHIAIIMDGNARWARSRGLEKIWGHRQGAETVRKVIQYCLDKGIENLSLFAFSTENWERPKKEVDYLMELFVEYIKSQLPELKEKEIRFLIAGDKRRFPSKVKKACDLAEKETSRGRKLNLVFCVNYGGRQEIEDASIKSLERGTNISKNLYNPEIPDVDLLIRTSGEKRISNFLLWQSAYSELYFIDVLWPDFGKQDMDMALKVYSRRKRKFGKRV